MNFKIILQSTLFALGFFSLSVSAVACPPMHVVIKEREAQVDLLKPTDNRGELIIYELDKSGKALSEEYLSYNDFYQKYFKDGDKQIVEGTLEPHVINERTSKHCPKCHNMHEKGIENERWGFKNKTGKVVIPPRYLEVHPFKCGRAAVRKNKKWFFIDETGKKITEDFLNIQDYSQNLAAVNNIQGWFFVDKNGKQAFSQAFDNVESFSEGLAQVRFGEKSFFIDTTGKKVFECKDYKYYDFKNGLSVIDLWRYYHSKPSEYGLVDKAGTVVVKPQYSRIYQFDDGRIFAEKRNNDSIFEKCLLLGMYLIKFRSEKHGYEVDWKYPAPGSVRQALVDLNDIFDDNFKSRFRSLSKEEMNAALANFHQFFGYEWKLTSGQNKSLISEFKSRGITEPDQMVANIFQRYWTQLQSQKQISTVKTECDH